MTHSIETKKKVLRMLNEGFNVKQVFLKTGVTEKTIAKWVRIWNTGDAPKLKILKSLWKKLDEQSKTEKLNAKEMGSITKDILKMQSKLSISNKNFNNLK